MSDCSQEVDVFVAVSVGVALLEIDPREIREVAYGGGFAGAPQDRALHAPGVDVADRLEPRAENVLDAELGCDRLYLERQRRGGDRDGVPTASVRPEDLEHLGKQQPPERSPQQAPAEAVEVARVVSAERLHADTHEVIEVGPAGACVEASPQQLGGLAQREVAPPRAVF